MSNFFSFCIEHVASWRVCNNLKICTLVHDNEVEPDQRDDMILWRVRGCVCRLTWLLATSRNYRFIKMLIASYGLLNTRGRWERMKGKEELGRGRLQHKQEHGLAITSKPSLWLSKLSPWEIECSSQIFASHLLCSERESLGFQCWWFSVKEERKVRSINILLCRNSCLRSQGRCYIVSSVHHYSHYVLFMFHFIVCSFVCGGFLFLHSIIVSFWERRRI